MIAVAVGVLFVVGGHLLGGWALANNLRRSTLRIQETGPGVGLAVRHVSRDEITLQASGPRQEIGHPGTIGIAWDSGYGQVGEVIDVEDNRVTRSFRLMQGEPPPVCPDLPVDECPQAVLDSFAFPNGPEDLGLPHTEVAYPSALGPMGAWLIPAEGPTWAVHVHGWTASRREAVRMLAPLHRSGLTSMVIDYRNDPGAPADPSGHYRFGLDEWEDVQAAVEYALGAGAEDVVCVGYSTGAAHVLSFLEQSDLAPRVRGLVLDAPNVILAETVRHGSRGMRIPGLGRQAGTLLVEFGMWIADLRWDVDWDRTNYVQRASSIIEVPTLVFHGTADHRVPISISRQLQARVPEFVQLEESPAAGHVMSWNANPARYEMLLESFLAGLQN